jgi:predicted nucleic acid-binding protein
MDKIKELCTRIQGQRVYVDTNIFVYFLERNVRYFDLVVPFFQQFDAGLSFAFTGDATLAQTLYKPYQLDDAVRVSEIKSFFANEELLTVLPHTTKVFELAGELAAKRAMKLIDALHYATAVLAGCKFLITNDFGFVSSQEIEIISL